MAFIDTAASVTLLTTTTARLPAAHPNSYVQITVLQPSGAKSSVSSAAMVTATVARLVSSVDV
jgi:hypothetical protein